MPSPFPGMDPYLEGPEWSGFHAELSVEIARQLRPQLRPKYTAITNKYFITDTPDELVVSTQNAVDYHLRTAPGVGIARTSMEPIPYSHASVAIKEAPLELATVMPELVPQYVIKIRDVSERTLVALIEILSPANKRGKGMRNICKNAEKFC